MPYTKQTWTANVTPVTAAKMDYIETGLVAAADKPYVKVYRTAAQSLPNGAWTTMLWDGETTDLSGMHDAASNTNRLVAPSAGMYVAVLAAYLSGSTGAGLRGIQILLNSTTVNSGLLGQATWSALNGITNAIPAFAMAQLAAGDWVSAVGYCDLAGINLLTDSSFQMWKIS